MLGLEVTPAVRESLRPAFSVRQDMECRLGDQRFVVGTHRVAGITVDGLVPVKFSAPFRLRQMVCFTISIPTVAENFQQGKNITSQLQ